MLDGEAGGQAGAPAVDFGKAASDYARHRQGFPDAFFERLQALGVRFEGSLAVDLGTGTGLFARALASRGAKVTGVDPSADLLDKARQADAGGVSYIRAVAEATGLAPGRFDIVSAATAWHWFDRSAAAREAFHLLVPGGALLICHLDWWRGPSGIVELTGRVVERFNPAAGRNVAANTFQYPAWLKDLREAGFLDFEMFASVVSLNYSHEAWVGRVKASASVAPALSPEEVRAFEEAFSAELRRHQPAERFDVEHIAFGLVARKGG